MSSDLIYGRALGSTKKLVKIRSVYFVQLDFWSSSDDCERVRQIIQCTLLSKNFAATELAHYKVFLFLFVVNCGLAENIWKHFYSV